jgi:streptogramin lyase
MDVVAHTEFRRGQRIRVRGRGAVFVKRWGAGAVVRYDLFPQAPKVVPIARVEPA